MLFRSLLILGVHESAGPLGRSLLHIWPSYVAYAVTFVTIGIIWVNHHTVLGQVARVDRRFLLINVMFLMLVAFIPFVHVGLPIRFVAHFAKRWLHYSITGKSPKAANALA